jgi:hypothetical protein
MYMPLERFRCRGFKNKGFKVEAPAAGLMNTPLKTNETPSKLLEAEPNRENAITASAVSSTSLSL